MLYPRKISGFTLLEVLIALLVFSLGLMGLAGLLVVAVRTNHQAYLRTQASFLAQSMADRMRANMIGVWGPAGVSSYNGTYGDGHDSGTPGCTSTSSTPTTCSPANVATRDGLVWSKQLTGFLPDKPTGKITCSVPAGVTVPSAAQLLTSPPYAGTCAINITWNEVSVTAGVAASPQPFDLVFQP